MLNFENRNGIAIVRLPVDVDASNAATIHAEILAGSSNQSPALVVELSATRYLDSAGIDMLFRLYERLQVRRQQMVLVVPDDAPLMRVLRIVAIPEIMSVRPSLDSAMDAVDGTEEQPVGAG